MSIRRHVVTAIVLALGLDRIASADTGPEIAVTGFCAAYAGGSADAALDFLTAEARAAEGRRIRREVTVRCMRMHSLHVVTVKEEAGTATVDATVTVSRWSAAPGAQEEIADDRTRFTLTFQEGCWKISERRDLVADLASRIAQAAPEERRALLAANPSLRTRALGMAIGTRIVTMIDHGQVSETAALLDVIRELNGELLDDRLDAVTLGLKSIVARRRSNPDFDESRRLAEAGLSIAERTHDPDLILEATSRLVRVRLDVDSTDETAFRLTGRALELRDYAVEPARVALLATQAARHCDAKSLYRDALIYSLMAQRFAAESGNVPAQLSAEMNLAGTYRLRSDFDLAEGHYRNALALSRELGFISVTISTLGDFAISLSLQGRPDEAIPFLEEAILLARQEGDPDHLLAGLYLSKAHLSVARGDVSGAAQSLASATADPHFGPRDQDYYSLLQANVLFGQRRYREALETSEKVSWRSDVEAAALRALGRHAEAERVLREIIDARNRLRTEVATDARQQSLYAATTSGDWLALVDVLVDCGDTAMAFAEYERMKGQVLRETIAHSGQDAGGLTAAERASLSTFNKRINEANRLLWAARTEGRDTAGEEAALAQARLELEEFESVRYAADPSRRWFVADEIGAGNVQLPDIPGGVIIAFAVMGERTVAFVVTPDARVSAAIIPIGRDALRRQVGELLEDIESQGLRTEAKSRALYDLLIKPLESKIGASRLIGIIPDDVIWRVPFHALRSGDGRFLVERAALFYAPSLHALRLALDRTNERATGAAPRLFALANLFVGAAARSRFRALSPQSGSLDEIPEAESEVRQIAALYGRNASRVYIGSAATESVVKSEAPAFDVVHIATHGLLDDTAPMYSALLLGGDGEKEDGLLEAREILDMRLHARVAVLSACETGRGRVTPAEGVIGMSWALFAAGCPTSVVSLWKAESAATQTLMVELHRRLIRGESPAVALRHAQLRVMRDPKTAHPMYWAPFVVVGAP
jgi:CHAT domain-containing protein